MTVYKYSYLIEFGLMKENKKLNRWGISKGQKALQFVRAEHILINPHHNPSINYFFNLQYQNTLPTTNGSFFYAIYQCGPF